MCNRYSNQITYRQYVEAFSTTRIPLVFPKHSHAPNLEPRSDIRPTDPAPILRAVEGGLELKELRWGLIPFFHKGSQKEWKILTTNARSEKITTTPTYKEAFAKRRCLVPVDCFYEWTGEKGKKIKWSFQLEGRDWFCFAGIWDRASLTEGNVESFSLITHEATSEVKPYHDRQPLILNPDHYETWLAKEPVTNLEELKSTKKIIVKQVA